VPNANGENAFVGRRALSAIIPPMAERVYAEFSDGRKGWYVVTEERPDGSLVVRPATSKEVYRAESDDLAAFDPPPPDW
jgi:hypothetical protein